MASRPDLLTPPHHFQTKRRVGRAEGQKRPQRIEISVGQVQQIGRVGGIGPVPAPANEAVFDDGVGHGDFLKAVDYQTYKVLKTL
jgi:hypothetical protein